jgi:hypothetical protein
MRSVCHGYGQYDLGCLRSPPPCWQSVRPHICVEQVLIYITLQVAYLLLEAGATTSASSDVQYGWQILHQKMEQDVPSLKHALVSSIFHELCRPGSATASSTLGWFLFCRRRRSGRYRTQWSRTSSCRMRSARSRYLLLGHGTVIWHIPIVIQPMHRRSLSKCELLCRFFRSQSGTLCAIRSK